MRKLKKGVKLILILSIIIFVTIVISVAYYNISIKSVSNESKYITLEIKSGSGVNTIIDILNDNDLIRSKLVAKIYVKLNKVNNLKAGKYKLNQNMNLKEIFRVLEQGNNYNAKEITITFNEGITMRKVASIIAKNTVNTEEDVYILLEDTDYINYLIGKYWFLDDVILNQNIYYPLEGYLAPNTYNFTSENVSVKEIFEKLLDQTNLILMKYKNQIDQSNYTVHEILTMASMAEAEGVTLNDRKNITSVFYNRIKIGMSLGSDVTTYYAVKKELNSGHLTTAEFNTKNEYNTRGPGMSGKLPIGPINNMSENSIIAALNPNTTDYYYFVADANRKCYFSKTQGEQTKVINQLKDQGLWL